MHKFGERDVIDALRDMVDKSSLRKTAAILGVNFSLISMVLNRKRRLTDSLSLRIGYVHLGNGVYMRAPKQK